MNLMALIATLCVSVGKIGTNAFAPSAIPSRIYLSMKPGNGKYFIRASSRQAVSEGTDAQTGVSEYNTDYPRSERPSLDLTETVYRSTMKSPKDAYVAFAEKGASNARMSKKKILHQSILGGCYVGFGGLLSLSIAGNMAGISAANPGLSKFAFAALFPVDLLLIVTTGGQLFTGNSATVAAAKFEKLISTHQLVRNWGTSIVGNIIGCGLFALAANYVGLLQGGTAALAQSTAMAKCSAAFGPTILKAVLCNWMVGMAVFLAGASNSLTGKLVGCWFPISLFVGIGLEHSVANMFILAAAMLSGVPIGLNTVIFKNLIPVLIGNGK